MSVDEVVQIEASPAERKASPKILTLVKGTIHGEWADPGSPFRTTVLEPLGITVSARVNYWSGDIAGLPKWLNPWTVDPCSDWRIGGDFLAAELSRLPFEDRNILTHSHGLQVGAFAAAQLPIRSFVSIAGPVRNDKTMRPIYEAALANVGAWVQVSDAHWDKTQWLGEWFDGRKGRVKDLPFDSLKVRNIRMKNISHSDLLYDQSKFPRWRSEGLEPLLVPEKV